jgi:hypothetical protein
MSKSQTAGREEERSIPESETESWVDGSSSVSNGSLEENMDRIASG